MSTHIHSYWSGEEDKNGIVHNRVNDRRSTVVDRSRRCTIGLTLNGCYIEFTVPGGPAHLSNALEKDDQVVTVDGHLVDSRNVVDMLVGSDEPGSRVLLGVRKHSTHELVDVPLRRVPEFALETMVALFKKITVLKQNGQRMKAYEAQTYPSGQEMTVRLSDHIAHLISKRELERSNFDTFGAQIADKEATSHLTELEQQMDHLSKTLTDPCFENAQQILDIKNREIQQLKSMLEVKEDALRMAIRKASEDEHASHLEIQNLRQKVILYALQAEELSGVSKMKHASRMDEDAVRIRSENAHLRVVLTRLTIAQEKREGELLRRIRELESLMESEIGASNPQMSIPSTRMLKKKSDVEKADHEVQVRQQRAAAARKLYRFVKASEEDERCANGRAQQWAQEAEAAAAAVEFEEKRLQEAQERLEEMQLVTKRTNEAWPSSAAAAAHFLATQETGSAASHESSYSLEKNSLLIGTLHNQSPNRETSEVGRWKKEAEEHKNAAKVLAKAAEDAKQEASDAKRLLEEERNRVQWSLSQNQQDACAVNNDLKDVTSVSYSRGSVWRYVHHDKECQTEVKSDEIQQKFSKLGLLLQRANAQEPAPESKSETVVQPDTTGNVFALEVLVFELREKLAAFEVALRQQEVELRQQSDKSEQLERENSELAVLKKQFQAELLTAIVHRNRAQEELEAMKQDPDLYFAALRVF